MRPIGPGSLEPTELLATLADLSAAIIELQAPTKPTLLASVLEADLPDADLWRECAISVSDANCIAISTEVTGTYAWLRADGSAI